MRPVRAFGPSFRIAIALLFGFMSLAHGPVMAFAQAKAPQTQHQPAAHHTGHDVQHAGHHGANAVDHRHHHRGADTVCYSNGCFVAVTPLSVIAPMSASSPLQQLTPAPARAIVPAELDPSVPPPRLQV